MFITPRFVTLYLFNYRLIYILAWRLSFSVLSFTGQINWVWYDKRGYFEEKNVCSELREEW